MLLDEIINIPALESINIECKSRLNLDDPEGWLKTPGELQPRYITKNPINLHKKFLS